MKYIVTVDTNCDREVVCTIGKVKDRDGKTRNIEVGDSMLAKAFVKDNYGEDYLEILEQALSWGQIIISGEVPRMHA